MSRNSKQIAIKNELKEDAAADNDDFKIEKLKNQIEQLKNKNRSYRDEIQNLKDRISLLNKKQKRIS